MTHPLRTALDNYYTPDPSIVSQLDKNGISLNYVGHAEITKMLIEIDPEWSWEPCEFANGRPVTFTHAGMIKRRDAPSIEVPTVSMWGRLTLLGVTRLAIGSVDAHKPDLDKELVSDFLRNAAMRFGVCLSLWAKSVNTHSSSPAHQSASPNRPWAPTTKQIGFLRALGHAGPMPATRNEFDARVESLKQSRTAPDSAYPPMTDEDPF